MKLDRSGKVVLDSTQTRYFKTVRPIEFQHSFCKSDGLSPQESVKLHNTLDMHPEFRAQARYLMTFCTIGPAY